MKAARLSGTFGLCAPVSKSRAAGFTLVEMLVVVAIIALLIGVSFGTYGSVLRLSQRIKCASNLRAIGVALFAFAGDNDQQLPQTGLAVPLGAVDAGTGKPSWMEQLDPYDGTNHKLFLCPSVNNGYVNNYFLMAWAAFYAGGMNYPTPAVRTTLIKNTVATILAGDNTLPSPGDADPDDAAAVNILAFGGKPVHSKMVNLLFTDGHVEAFSAWDKTLMTNRYEGTGYDENSTSP